MQTVKNLFLWNSRSYLRKVLEIPIAIYIDALWPKKRILEVYLNIAEFGEGIFGVEAAAQTYFNRSAARLGPRAAASVDEHAAQSASAQSSQTQQTAIPHRKHHSKKSGKGRRICRLYTLRHDPKPPWREID